MNDDERIRARATLVGGFLDAIRALFLPGYCLALVVWKPGSRDNDFIMHDPGTTVDDAIAALQRRRDDKDTIFGRVGRVTRKT